MKMDEQTFQNKLNALKAHIKSYPDFPKRGILFRDIFAALAHGPTCSLLKELLIETIKRQFPDVEAVIGLESRGFLFCFSIAADLGVPCIPVRKKGKLPGEINSFKYELEYGTDTFEIQKGSLRKGQKCLIVDDLIATGGSLGAAISLVQESGADVTGCLLVIELKDLNGRDKLPVNIPVHSLIGYE